MINPDPKPEKTIKLKGKAMEALRLACYKRDKGVCQQCNKFVWWGWGHMAHIERRAKGGDVLSNVTWKCFDCHIGLEHGQGIK